LIVNNTRLAIPVVTLVLMLMSWSYTGHRTIGRIAEKHLTPKASAAVKELLGSETLAAIVYGLMKFVTSLNISQPHLGTS
jgi:hypothetical protein